MASRYAGLPQAIHLREDGTPVPYLRRRFLPRELPQPLALHFVVQGDRPDTLAARYLADPEAGWQIADANGVMHPQELVEEVGRRIAIALPGGNRG
ncbi:LysM domain-containing protein [Aquincola sp. J276]|uniref:LysM domain-containing protein n=1 Tax=Aquincola sp. J276 TaxID=2898432 RepID=UPI002151E19E|nr:LysM domain-containing protein [Aquincola sp. J276]MCR5868340.1 LysM domain-containing protein [Aquincola sp. J276]